MNCLGLKDYQRTAAAHLRDVLCRRGSALDASDLGTGKTFVACSLVREFDLPTLVVCPESIISTWRSVANRMGTDVSAINYEMVRTGRTPFGRWTSTLRGGRKFRWADEIRFLIFDEVHRCKGEETQNANLLWVAKEQGIPTLMLSATPAQSPLDMRAMAYMLDLYDATMDELAFKRWTLNYGVTYSKYEGFKFSGTREECMAHMKRLHDLIFPERGHRVRIADIPDFPETQISVELITLPKTKQIDTLYEEIQEELREFWKEVNAPSLRNPMVMGLRQRQAIELTKAPAYVEIARDAVEQGMSVVIFVNFSRTIEWLAENLGTDCIVWGKNKNLEERDRNVARFQSDEERIIICNTAAGGVGLSLHDITGRHPRLSLFSLGCRADDLRQALGRVRRSGGKTKSFQKVLLAADTREERGRRSLATKLDQLDALVDGDIDPVNLKFEQP